MIAPGFYALQQGGGDKRARWYGDKRSKIYEWDSRYGELEGDRASDGEHPGAFDPKTGKQVKAPDSKRIQVIFSILFSRMCLIKSFRSAVQTLHLSSAASVCGATAAPVPVRR